VSRTRRALVVGSVAGLVVAGLVTAPSASAGGPPFTPVVTGLVNPTHLAFGPGHTLYVADIGTASVSRHNLMSGSSTTLAGAPGLVAGVDVNGAGNVFWTSNQSAGIEQQGPTFLERTNASGRTWQKADMLAWELAHNPDGQDQSAPDSKSNPYSVLALGDRVIVADAGANDLIEVRANGSMRTLAVFPTFTNPGCGPNNNGDISCDPVPTDVELGPDGYLYVSGLGAEVEGHIYKVNASTGAIVQTWGGLPPLTGIAVSPDGTIYAASLIAGFGGSPSTVVRVQGGVVTSTMVPVPTDVEWGHGMLLVASFTGTVYSVDLGSFH